MAKRKWIVIFLVSIVLALGCAPPLAVVSPSPPPPVTEAILKTAWQEEWDKTLAAAKNEREVVIYHTGGGEIKAALIKAFREKFGIGIEYVSGRPPELAVKLLSERKAGLYLADLYLAGASAPITVKPEGVLAPIKPLLFLPEVLDTKAYFDNEIPFLDKEGIYIICNGPYVAMTLAVNSDLVKPDEIKGYADLLHPKWKGKIVIDDPTIGGPAQKMFFYDGRFYNGP